MSTPAQQTQITADNAELKRLIAELPVSDGIIPINDVVKDGQVVSKGAHGVANDTESKIAGITKRYIVSSLLQTASNPAVDADNIYAAIKQVVTSADASEKQIGSSDEAKTRTAAKIEALGLNDETKAVVTAIVNGQITDEIRQKIASQAFVESLPPGDLRAAVDDSVNKLAQEHHYQITTEGNLFNLSSVRLGHVEGRPALSGENGLQATFYAQSDDVNNKTKSVEAFLSNIGKEWLESKNEINIYDIAYGGKPEAAIAAVQAIRAIKPDMVVNYTGVDLSNDEAMAKRATEALQAVGVNSIKLESGTFGRAEFDSVVASDSHKGKMDLVLGTHVYNLGNSRGELPTTFLRQVDELMSPDALSLIQHERGQSWINDIRNAHPDKLRGGASTVVEDLSQGLTQSGQDFKSFGSPTTVKFYTGENPHNTLFKDKYVAAIQDMEAGKYDIKTRNALMEKHGITSEEDKKEFGTLVNLLEFFARSPLESFTTQNRMAIVGDIHKEAERQAPDKPFGQTIAYTEVQVLPKNKERLEQVEQAVEATKAQLAPQSLDASQIRLPITPQQQQPGPAPARVWTRLPEQQQVGAQIQPAVITDEKSEAPQRYIPGRNPDGTQKPGGAVPGRA